MTDLNLGQVREVARTAGACTGPRRIVVASDHGEHLGEHTLEAWPEPVSGQVLHQLVLERRLFDPPPPVTVRRFRQAALAGR